MADSNITRNAMAAAMKALMKEKKLSKISISDICGACGMNRNSFYYHFKDIYVLVEGSCLEYARIALQGKNSSSTWHE